MLPREESSPHGPAFGGSFPLSRNRADIFSGFIVGGARRVLLTNVPSPLSRGTKGVVWTVNHNYMYIVQSSEINVRHQVGNVTVLTRGIPITEIVGQTRNDIKEDIFT